ncbi:hypothetical protein Tcan_01812 [Toxocara canis]|uniref:Uncharacterized protein n=1 Tax=Toxocara canis TaxID=6265 RepID=A0A0B2VRD4_TOXCA|nr:hypothetical protein Tcan_01812 [Toxocara canis]
MRTKQNRLYKKIKSKLQIYLVEGDSVFRFWFSTGSTFVLTENRVELVCDCIADCDIAHEQIVADPNTTKNTFVVTSIAAVAKNTRFHCSAELSGASTETPNGTSNIVSVIPSETLPVTNEA